MIYSSYTVIEDSENFISIQSGLYQPKKKHSCERHRFIVLFDPEGKTRFTWRLPGEKIQKVILKGPHVLFIEKQIPIALFWEDAANLLSLNFTDDFIHEFAPGYSLSGVSIKTCREILEQDTDFSDLENNHFSDFFEPFQRECFSERKGDSIMIHSMGCLFAVFLWKFFITKS